MYTYRLYSRKLGSKVDYVGGDKGGYISGYGVIDRLSGFRATVVIGP